MIEFQILFEQKLVQLSDLSREQDVLEHNSWDYLQFELSHQKLDSPDQNFNLLGLMAKLDHFVK